MPYYVSRQNSWPSGELYVEIETGGLDSAGPDMLRREYEGEAVEYDDPRDAASAAIAIRSAWQKDDPDGSILIAMGSTGGGLVAHDPSDYSDDQVMEWADRAYDGLPACPRCGDHVEGLDWQNGNSTWTGDKFCSERCAKRAQESDDEHTAELDREEFGVCPECDETLTPEGVCPDCGDK